MADNNNNDLVTKVDNVVILPVETTLDLPLDRILDGARDHELTDCLVLGYTSTGFYMASTTVNAGTILILLERCRRLLMNRLSEDPS